MSGCAGMVKAVVPTMSQSVALQFISFVSFSSTVISVVGVSAFAWVCNAYIFFESTKIFFFTYIRIGDSINFMVASFTIASLYSIAAHEIACIPSSLLTWSYFSCVSFSDAPYPWAAAVAFLRI